MRIWINQQTTSFKNFANYKNHHQKKKNPNVTYRRIFTILSARVRQNKAGKYKFKKAHSPP